MSLPTFESGPIRPPSEAASLLLRVTRNCPWNRCRFCHTYRGAGFGKRSVAEVRQDISAMKIIAEELAAASWRLGLAGVMTAGVLREFQRQTDQPRAWECLNHVAAWLHCGGQHVFLQDANSLVLPAGQLVEILGYLREAFPAVERVTTYARSQTIARAKTEADLLGLRRAGLTRIHAGLESGSDTVLKLLNKGVTAAEHVAAGQKIVAAGLELSEYFMPGAGGKEWSAENAAASARVLNQINPHFIRLRTFTPVPGTELMDDVAAGRFAQLPDDDAVREIRQFVAALDGITSTVASDHIMNLLEEVEGTLPQDQERMLSLIDEYLNLPDEERQLFQIGRRLGLFRALDDLGHHALRRQAEAALAQLAASGRDLPEALRLLAQRYI